VSAPGRPRLLPVEYWIWILIAAHVLGLLSVVRALFETRTSQGAVAWVLSLLFVPYFAVPSYWFFGRSRFDGYRFLRRQRGRERIDAAAQVKALLNQQDLAFAPQDLGQARVARVLERLARMPFTSGNRVQLLVDGVETFEAILAAIAKAKSYLLVEFYILKDDNLGRRLGDALSERAAAGVRVHVLYDEIGSYWLPSRYPRALRKRGVAIRAFDTSRGRRLTSRLNFRNHRKLVVVDGVRAFVGGHNVADEYLGTGANMPAWRDTHLELSGPAVLGAQVAFAEDWLWSSGETLELNRSPKVADDPSGGVLIVPSGPADTLNTATLMMLEIIGSACRRLWIVSPYFAPEPELLAALQLAALRGVDVRILVPENSDEPLVHLASFSYLKDLDRAGVKLLRYLPGYMHQKVVLVDDHFAAVGTANFDNRSMRLNFEITAWVHDVGFAAQVEAMLEGDFARARLASPDDYFERKLPFRLAVRAARLLSPLL